MRLVSIIYDSIYNYVITARVQFVQLYVSDST